MTGARILNEFRKEIASNVIEDNELNWFKYNAAYEALRNLPVEKQEISYLR